MSCCIIQFPVEICNRGWQGGLITSTRDENFGKGGYGVTQDKGGLLVGGEGDPIWSAGVIEKGREELAKIQSDMRGYWAFQNEVDYEPVTPDWQ